MAGMMLPVSLALTAANDLHVVWTTIARYSR